MSDEEEQQPDNAWWPMIVANLPDGRRFLHVDVEIRRRVLQVSRFSAFSKIYVEDRSSRDIIYVSDLATLRVALLHFHQTGELPK